MKSKLWHSFRDRPGEWGELTNHPEPTQPTQPTQTSLSPPLVMGTVLSSLSCLPHGYKIKDEDRTSFDNGERLEGGIFTATEAWFKDRSSAEAKYGPISSWNTSEVRST